MTETMQLSRRRFLQTSALVGSTAVLTGCSTSSKQEPEDSGEVTADVDTSEFASLAMSDDQWCYDEDSNIYYQLNLTYCKNPATTTYESLAVFVPGNYFTGEAHGSTYTVTINEKAVVGGFTPRTAPILMPINTGSLGPQQSPTAYAAEGLENFLNMGCIYVYAGFRGRSAGYDTASGSDKMFAGGAPWPVVDMKAAIRFLRYNAAHLPCDTKRVFCFGFGAGGGLSAMLGASGSDSAFDPYLKEIGACTHDNKGNTIGDAIMGAAMWCPEFSYGSADAAYEWSTGQFMSADQTPSRDLERFTGWLSTHLSTDYAYYINDLKLSSGISDTEPLSLSESGQAVYTAGSYYEALAQMLSDSATNFVQTATFPHTFTPNHLTDPSFPGDPNLRNARASDQLTEPLPSSSEASSTNTGEQGASETSNNAADDAAEKNSAAGTTSTTSTDNTSTDESGTQDQSSNKNGILDNGSGVSASKVESTANQPGIRQVQSLVVDSVQDYVNLLNRTMTWFNYNSRHNVVSITDIPAFASTCRDSAYEVLPYDSLGRSSKINQLFGVGEQSTLHFSTRVSKVLSDNAEQYTTLQAWDKDYVDAWESDLEITDALKTSIEERVNMMDPLSFLLDAAAEQPAETASFWRINDGAFDTTIPLTNAFNLAHALAGKQDINVTHTHVWGVGHVLAETEGSAVDNLLSWVVDSCKQGA